MSDLSAQKFSQREASLMVEAVCRGIILVRFWHGGDNPGKVLPSLCGDGSLWPFAQSAPGAESQSSRRLPALQRVLSLSIIPPSGASVLSW